MLTQGPAPDPKSKVLASISDKCPSIDWSFLLKSRGMQYCPSGKTPTY